MRKGEIVSAKAAAKCQPYLSGGCPRLSSLCHGSTMRERGRGEREQGEKEREIGDTKRWIKEVYRAKDGGSMIVSPSKRSNDTSQVIDSVLREETETATRPQ